MQRTFNARFFITATLAFLLLIAGIYLMPRFNPFFAGAPNLSRSEARAVVDTYLRGHQIDLHDFYLDSYFLQDGSGLDYLMRTRGIGPTFALANEEALPLSYWQFFYYRNVPKDAQQEIYLFRVSRNGRLIGFSHVLPDSVSGAKLEETEARKMADAFLQSWPEMDLSHFALEQSIRENKPGRTDYKLVYKRDNPEIGEGWEAFEIRIAGDAVVGALWHFYEPSTFARASGVVGGANLLFNSISVGVYVLMTILAFAVFLRKYHAGQIGVRRGFRAGTVVYISMLLVVLNIWSYFALGTGIGSVSYLYTKLIVLGMQMVTVWAFMGLNVLAAWNAGIHETRVQKPSLLSGINSLIHRNWLTKNIGREVTAGFLYGLMLFGGMQILAYLLIAGFGAVPRVTNQSFSAFTGYLPALGILAGSVAAVLFSEVVFRLFLITYLSQKMRSATRAVLFSAAMYSVFLIFFHDGYAYWPAYFMLIPGLAAGIALGVIFWQSGFLATLVAAAVYTAGEAVGPMLSSEAAFFQGNAIAVVLAFTGLFVGGVVCLWKGKDVEIADDEEPEHIRRIKEQTRIQKELEIARRVQLGLLPKEQPTLTGFDIAGICLPAQEVGGDYFDFIKLSTGNLGIAVGDVSGKGVPAAIYMTLTKGILQSHAEADLSPKQVLSKVNNLMYRTIERSWYVSMFYAVLNARKRLLRFARAGHNPAIVLNKGQSAPKLLQTAGIGLGLDVGEIFAKTLVEGELELASGDTLVFYTDGFTEAMNEEMEEFGEERFLQLLAGEDNGSAQGLVQKTVAEIRAFAGSAPQHDDMTMVVLKVF